MSERAIVYFQEQSCRDTTSAKALLYNTRAIQALEKRVPKLVTHNRTFWHYSHYCPDCNSYLEKEGLKYCPDCGQALDWSNYEEGLKYVR